MNRYPATNGIPPPYAVDAAATAGWARWVRDKWHAVRVTQLQVVPMPADVPGPVRLRVNVHLGVLAPADVLVEAIEEGAAPAEASDQWPVRLSSTQSYGNGTYVFEGLLPREAAERRQLLTVRARPGATHEALSALNDVVRSFAVGAYPEHAAENSLRSRAAPASVAGSVVDPWPNAR